MSIEDIFAALDEYEPGSLREDTVTSIKAALKAAQAMRDEFVNTIQGEWGPCEMKDLYLSNLGLAAWDAAIKEEDV